MSNNPHKSLAVAICAAISVISTGVAAAPTLEEVIVTAEKREESLQDVPISIATFTESTLEKMGVHDIKGLASKVPNLVVNEFTGSSTTVRLFIRGVGQNDVQVTQDPSVALYMDGVYIGSSVGTAFESADTQRIEVLRGPQGTLYGRNATGGAINLITNKASTEELNFRQRLTAGNLDLFRSRSILNVPITDTTAIKLAYSNSKRDGLVDNKGNGDDWGKEDRDNITADFHWDAADALTLDYKYDRSTIKDTSRLSQVLNFDNSAPLSFVVGFENPQLDGNGNPLESGKDRLDDATSYDKIEKGDVKINAHTLNLAWEINDILTFKSITGYRDVDSFSQMAQTPTTFLALGPYSVTNGLPDTDFEQYSQEFQLLGVTDNFTWVGGLYYYEDESEETNLGAANGSENLSPGQLVDYTSTENTSIAVFGQVTWTPEPLERWHFTVGARYSDDNRKAERDNNRVSFGLGGKSTTVPAFRSKYDKDFDKFNPSFTVEYEINDFSNVYGKVVTAYKSGGTSQRSTSAQNFEAGFKPEELTSYELGYKGDLMDGRMRLNAAAFYMQYDDYQQSVQTGRNAGERDFVNIKDADIAGMEMDLTLAITDELTGTLGYGYLDTSFGPNTVSYLQIDDTSPSGFTTVEEGLTDDLALAPEHSFTASLDYNRLMFFGVINANVNMQYQDESNGGIQVPSGVLNDRTLVAATLGVSEIELGKDSGRLRVTLWGNNLFDEEYHIGNIRQSTFDDLGLIGLATFGDPRTYGVTLEYEYR